MKSLFPAVLVISAVFSLSVSSPAQQPEKPKMKMHNMMGCLTKTDTGSYLVMNSDPKGPKRIGIVSSKTDLSPHVGQVIQITGIEVPMKEAEATKDVPKADHYMKLSGVKMMSATCP